MLMEKQLKEQIEASYGKTFLRICDGCGAGKIKNDQCGPDGAIWPSGYSYYDGTDQTDGQYCQKLMRRGRKYVHACVDTLNDIAGIRVVCFFCDDIYRVADYVKKQKDITLLKEKDYVKNPKKSGYQSIHLIVGVPVTYLEKTKEIRWRYRSVLLPWTIGQSLIIRCVIRKMPDRLKMWSVQPKIIPM